MAVSDRLARKIIAATAANPETERWDGTELRAILAAAHREDISYLLPRLRRDKARSAEVRRVCMISNNLPLP